MEKVAFLAHIRGMVQGVGFRYFTYHEASSRDLTGYVKNLPDGRVEVYAEGSKEDLNSLLQRLQEGPGSGYVKKIEVEWETFHNKYQQFSVERSYF